jgi:hypothetical protein
MTVTLHADLVLCFLGLEKKVIFLVVEERDAGGPWARIGADEACPIAVMS